MAAEWTEESKARLARLQHCDGIWPAGDMTAYGAVTAEVRAALARIEELERELTEWTAMAGEQRHRAEELERLKNEPRSGHRCFEFCPDCQPRMVGSWEARQRYQSLRESRDAAETRGEAAKALLVEVREEMNRRLRAAEDRDAVLNTEISGLQAKLAEARAGSDLAVTNLRDALAAEREKARAIHAMLEKFADDLDTGPSTHLLATELRNRWRVLRDEEPKP